MSIPDLPEDLVASLQGKSPITLDAAHYETVALIPIKELRVETLEVTPNLAPFACDHPHAGQYGHYAVPAVNLVRDSPKRKNSFPAWLFLWLPNERRYGSYDLDHGDLMVYAPRCVLGADCGRSGAVRPGQRRATRRASDHRILPTVAQISVRGGRVPRLSGAKKSNQTLQPTGHANEGSSCVSAFSRVSRLLSWGRSTALRCEAQVGFFVPTNGMP